MSISFARAEVFRSVELIWILWILSLAGLGIAIYRRPRFDWYSSLKQFHVAESGAAYTLSYVFSFPVYMLLICTVIQCSLVLVVKIGTMYACYAGARSAAVWISAKPNVANEKIHLAVVQALTPFAEGTPVHTMRLGVTPEVTSDGIALHKAYSLYAGSRSRAPVTYLAHKYSYATKAVSISWSPSEPVENQDITLVMTYQMPLHIPGAARILGHPHGLYPITSRAVLQNEGPKREAGFNPDHPLGIDYRSLP